MYTGEERRKDFKTADRINQMLQDRARSAEFILESNVVWSSTRRRLIHGGPTQRRQIS